MIYPTPYNKQTWSVHLKEARPTSAADDALLFRLVAELDNDGVTAIILKGSYARGDATFYSDVDLTRFVKKPPDSRQQKQFIYRDGHLISVSTRTISQERKRFTTPESAIFVVSGIREARTLLDKEGAFQRLQQEARAWTWKPLQADANYYASNVMMIHTEYVHKILRALHLHDEFALSEISLELLFELTEAVAVQRGMLVISGNTYFRQVEEMVGLDSTWTSYHRFIAGIDANPLQSVNGKAAKGVAVLRLYQETVKLLRYILHPGHRDVVEQTVLFIDNALSDE